MLHRFANLALLTSLVLLHVTACSSTRAPTDAWAGTVDTLPNGALWIFNPEEGLWDDDSRWMLTEDLRIGSVDSGKPDHFADAWAITADSLGRIYVADRQSKDIRVFDPDGQHVRTLGRRGKGPSDFQDPWGMAWGPRGNLWVVDVQPARYSVFDSGGTLVATYPRTAPGYAWPWTGVFTRDSLLVEEDPGASHASPLVGRRVSGGRLVVTDMFPDPLGAPPLSDYDLFDLTDDSGVGTTIPVPFGRGWVRTLDAVGGVWVGHNADYRIAHQTLEGDTVMLIGRDVRTVPVNLRDRSTAVTQLGEYRNHPGIDLNRIPDTKPWFVALLPAPDGTLWVLRNLEGQQWAFEVFDSRGRFLGTVDLPVEPTLAPAPEILDEGVLLVTRDGMDVSYVVRLALDRKR